MVAQEFPIASLDDLLALPAVYRDMDLRYLPVPNHVDVVKSESLADPALTRSAFVIAFFADGRAVFADHQKRPGLEIAGGHIDEGETMAEAAARELPEETGYHVKSLTPIGFQRLVSDGTKPEDYKYPFPLSFQQFFAGMVSARDDYTPNAECKLPVTMTPEHMLYPHSPLNDAQKAFVSLALDRLREMGLVQLSLRDTLALNHAKKVPQAKYE